MKVTVFHISQSIMSAPNDLTVQMGNLGCNSQISGLRGKSHSINTADSETCDGLLVGTTLR
jgi:hypothetical protein